MNGIKEYTTIGIFYFILFYFALTYYFILFISKLHAIVSN